MASQMPTSGNLETAAFLRLQESSDGSGDSHTSSAELGSGTGEAGRSWGGSAGRSGSSRASRRRRSGSVGRRIAGRKVSDA